MFLIQIHVDPFSDKDLIDKLYTALFHYNMEPIYHSLTQRALATHRNVNQVSGNQRTIIALAGPPGGGKSTIASQVVERLNQSSSNIKAVALPMDGFHLYCRQLDQLPNRDEAYTRRGAAWTFDGEGVLNLMKKLHQSKRNVSETIYAPGFDHMERDPVERAISINPATNIIIMEGNWLLYDERPWSEIHKYVDDTWFVDVDPLLARNRVAKRHLKAGVEKSWETAVKRVETNDLPNGVDVRNRLITPAIRVRSVEDVI